MRKFNQPVYRMNSHIIFLIYCLLPLFPIAKVHPEKRTEEQVVLAKINALYEVKDFMKTTPKTMKPIVMVDGKQGNYWWVKVGISNFDMLRTTYNFRIHAKTFKIYYWDEMADEDNLEDKWITLQQWRYWRTKPGWNDLHVYKHGQLVVLKQYLKPKHQ